MFKRTIRNTVLAMVATAAVAAPVFAQATDWQRQVARLIASKQTYPRIAQMRGEEGTVKVKVYVGAGGAVEKTELVAPSGSSTLDREALAMPARVGNFPAPPGGPTTLTVPITWKLM